MADERFLPAQNLRHNVITPQKRDEKSSLIAFAERYFLTQVGPAKPKGRLTPSSGTLPAFSNSTCSFTAKMTPDSGISR
jgi:hypothetical protein